MKIISCKKTSYGATQYHVIGMFTSLLLLLLCYITAGVSTDYRCPDEGLVYVNILSNLKKQLETCYYWRGEYLRCYLRIRNYYDMRMR